jgi:hypothetical protein
MSLSKLYYTYKDPAALSSIQTLTKKAKLPKQKVINFLKSQDAYTLHARALHKFPRKKYFVTAPYELIQMDLADMQRISKYNDGYRYILCTIDCFSRVARCMPVKTKKAQDMAEAIESILKTIPFPVRNVQSDLGGEFWNREVKHIFEKYSINHYSVYSELKAAIVERFIRTLKSKLYRYFTAENTLRYVDVLQDLVHHYNHSIHSSIKMAPADVNENNINQVWETLYGKHSLHSSKCTLKPGDYVRISKFKQKFEKGYLPNWSEEIFVVDQCIKSNPVTYKIRDWNGEVIRGIFYQEELQKINMSKNKSFLIEKVLKRRKGWLYVKWVGYPETMNSWVQAKSVQSQA